VALDKTAVRQTVLQFPRIPEQTEAKDSNDGQFACAFAVIGRAAAKGSSKPLTQTFIVSL
jgi:hypothetical protein